MKKAVVWTLIGFYGIPFAMKYVRAWGDRGLNK